MELMLPTLVMGRPRGTYSFGEMPTHSHFLQNGADKLCAGMRAITLSKQGVSVCWLYWLSNFSIGCFLQPI